MLQRRRTGTSQSAPFVERGDPREHGPGECTWSPPSLALVSLRGVEVANPARLPPATGRPAPPFRQLFGTRVGPAGDRGGLARYFAVGRVLFVESSGAGFVIRPSGRSWRYGYTT
jgi:hypothetical protein